MCHATGIFVQRLYANNVKCMCTRARSHIIDSSELI